MMEILFGLIVIALLVLGLRHRKKQDKKWLREERYEESGAWIDKRSGERGTYGSLDREMEQERRRISNLGKVEELVYLIQNHCVEYFPEGFSTKDPAGKEWLVFTKTRAAAFIRVIGQLPGGEVPELPEPPAEDHEKNASLKKKILDYSYEQFPDLLNLDLEVIKKFDLLARQLSDAVTEETERVKQER